MKNTIKILSLVLIAVFVNFQEVVSQEVAISIFPNLNTNRLDAYNISNESEDEIKSESTILSDGTYTFDNGKKEVLVEIKNGYYTEHYANNEFIQAKIKWVSKTEYNLVITKINKKGIPFGAGTLLNTKISKVKGSKYYYESNLEGLTWTGKFNKIK